MNPAVTHFSFIPYICHSSSSHFLHFLFQVKILHALFLFVHFLGTRQTYCKVLFIPVVIFIKGIKFFQGTHINVFSHSIGSYHVIACCLETALPFMPRLTLPLGSAWDCMASMTTIELSPLITSQIREARHTLDLFFSISRQEL